MALIKTKKSTLNNKILLFFMLFCLNISLFSQTVFCPPNLNFENGNLTNWRFYTGYCCPIVANSLTLPVTNRHVLMSGTGRDLYGNFPVVAPDGGNYSLKLGNDNTGAQAERARYYIRIPAGVNDYKLIFKYAVVFQDPQHDSTEQPRFTVNAYDSATNALLPCVNFNFIATSALPGFTRVAWTSDVFYKTWSSANLDLSGYGGRTIAVDFASGDCSQTGHFGYGYVDVNCDQFKISTISCKGNPISTLTGPSGFTEYKWYDSTFSTLLGSSQVLNITTPTYFNKYKLITKPYPNFGCADTLTTIIRISDLNLNLQNDTLVCGGTPFQLQNTATVSSFFQPIIYSWTPAAGLSCTNCLNPLVTPPSTTKYLLTTTDVNGCVQKDSFTVTLRLNIITQPKSTSVCLDSIAKFKVVVNGSIAFTYQWKKNGINIIGANSDSLIITNANYGDTANYSVMISAYCDSVLSNIVRLKVFKPVFFKQPTNLLQCPNSRAVFKTTVTSDTNMVYQWYKRGILVPGANKDSLVINNISNLDTGFYYLKVTGKCRYTISDTVKLSITITTIITSQPQAYSQCRNTPVIFKVTAIGPGILNYQWRKGNTNLIGQNKDSLVISNLNYLDSGNYSVRIWSLCDTVFSSFVKLIVFKSSTITTQPTPVSVCKDSSVRFKVTANGYGNVVYKWKKNGQDIIGANTDSLVFPIVNYSDSANYSVLVSSYCDSLLSNTVKLKVFSPILTRQPISILQCSGKKAVFKSTVINDTNIIYRWYKNGNLITGANKDSLVLNNITNSDTGFYQLKATGKCTSIFSDTVYLRLYKNTSIISQPQTVSQCINTRAFLSVKATGSGVVTYQWKKGNANLLGQTADSLIINNLNYSDTGNYTVKVKSICDSATSINVKLSIVPSTKITLQPQSVLQCVNSKVVLKVKGTGTGLVTYQWLKNDNVIPGSTADSLYFNAVNAADSANYSVIVRSFCDSIISQKVRIDLYPFKHPNFPDTTLLCTQVNRITLNGFKNYLWNTSSINNYIDIPNNGTYWVKVVDSNNCTNYDTTFVILNSLPKVNAGTDTMLCNNLPLKLNGFAINYDTVFWGNNIFGVFENKDSLSTIYRVNPTVTGFVNIVLWAKNNCGTINDSLQVDFTPTPTAKFILSDTLVCQGSAKVILIPDDSVGFFTGKNVKGFTYDPIDAGIYPIQYQITKNYCYNKSTEFIDVVPKPIADFTYLSLIPDIDEPVQFYSKSTNENQYLWTFENNKTSSIKNSSYHFTEEGIYNVELKAINRICYDTAVQFILVKGSKHIYMPNAFTPNQNGVNEAFKVVYKNSRGATLHIYNRWGQWLYTSSDLTKGWDGNFNGNPCEEDVYYYIVDYITNNGEAKQLKGNFTLLR
ncbi:MAG: T9SS type B sorting domain-containing protein [Bacteroidia bacterium]